MGIAQWWRKIRPDFLAEPSDLGEPGDRINYGRIWRFSILAMLTVAVVPLILLAVTNIHQYRQALRAEATHPVHRLVSNARRTVAFFLEERRSALGFLVRQFPFADLADMRRLDEIMMNLKAAFGGFTDLGLLSSDGVQVSYSGPYDLKGKVYQDQAWFKEVVRSGAYISDVFKGYRNVPHLVIAVRHQNPDKPGDFHVLRATLDTEGLSAVIQGMDFRPSHDAFLVNEEGVLQTASARYGGVLTRIKLSGLAQASMHSQVEEIVDDQGRPMILGLARVDNSPFIFVALKSSAELVESWDTLLTEMIVFLVVSLTVIFFVVLKVSTRLVSHIHEADGKRTWALHQVEYANKMATIGRLAAGVAHEINNPLAIINEKAGLLKDLVGLSDMAEYKEKFLKSIEAILYSIKRCSTITHRLLGFARQIQVQWEPIEIRSLVEEVLGFLGKEAVYRNVTISVQGPQAMPTIVSDRGQLQQVFLNIINNALAAVQDGGRIDIDFDTIGQDRVKVVVSDNGCGIPPEYLPRIFEPFFTTKGRKGTGLGLSITYGIVQKLGGEIRVESQVGQGTSFIVILPLAGPAGQKEGGLEGTAGR